MEKNKTEFIESSQVAIKGTANGIVGSMLYELFLTLFFAVLATILIGIKNPGASSDELNMLSNKFFDSFPLSIITTCLSSIVTLGVFVYLIGWDKIKRICKNLFTLKVLKYGISCAVVLMLFSIIYNSSIISIFNLGDTGNANQENVITLIKENILLGFVAVVILAPIVEELTYRYCLFGGVYAKKRWLAYLTSGLVFMFMHSLSSFLTYGFSQELLLEMVYLPPYLFSGLALCYVYEKSGNLGSGFIAHLLNNLVSFLAIVML